jgi:hypothetical protein
MVILSICYIWKKVIFCTLPERSVLQFPLAMVLLSKYKPYALLMHAENFMYKNMENGNTAFKSFLFLLPRRKSAVIVSP